MHAHAHSPIYCFPNNCLEDSVTQTIEWLTISHDLSCWPPKPVANRVFSVMQSPYLAHLNSYPPTRPSSAVWWTTALPRNKGLQAHCNLPQWTLVHEPNTFTSQTGQWSFIFYHLFLVLYPLLFPCFVQDTHGPPLSIWIQYRHGRSALGPHLCSQDTKTTLD